MIESIDVSIIWEGRKTGLSWFHPRVCFFPERDGPKCLMTCQSISGSDVFGPVHWSLSSDHGRFWTSPIPVPDLGRTGLANGLQEGVCDVVPGYHPQTDTILAMGHNVYYRNETLTAPVSGRYPVYTIRGRQGEWSARSTLQWPGGTVPATYTCGAAQRLVLDDGRILIPFSVGSEAGIPRSVCTAIYDFDGATLKVAKKGALLSLPIKRGLLEPSLALFRNRYYMTLRAEDGHGYVTASDDGLSWTDLQAWCWDDGAPLMMSTTQQRWITHSLGLFLVYTRKAEANVNVMRWRAPLYVSEVDTRTKQLIRTSERIVFPLIGDGVNNPDHVARMGNFHTANAASHESWVTVGEALPNDGWRGNTLLARIKWARGNELVK